MVLFRDIRMYFKSSCCNDNSVVDSDGAELSLDQTLPNLTELRDFLRGSYQIYEVTLTFSPKKLRAERFETDHYAAGVLLRRFISYLRKKGAKWFLIPEFTKAGALHYHGVLKFMDYSDSMHSFNYYKRNIGILKYRQIEDLYGEYKLTHAKGSLEGWHTYITKDKDKMNYNKDRIYSSTIFGIK